MIAEIGKEELLALTNEIFGSLAGIELTPAAVPLHPDRTKGHVVAAVQIVGSWQGAVLLDFDMELARQVSARLLGVEAEELSHDDIRDAAGELANITGGSVKAMIPGSCTLSLPSVVFGRDYEMGFPQGKVMQESSFCLDAGVLLLTIIEKQQPS